MVWPLKYSLPRFFPLPPFTANTQSTAMRGGCCTVDGTYNGSRLVAGGSGLLAAFFMIGTAIGPWVFNDHGNALIDQGLRLLIRPFYRMVGAIRSSWTF